MKQATHTEIEIEKGYYILFPKSKFLFLSIPATKSNKVSEFTHPNLFKTVEEELEFKHYHADGGKHWTSEPGVVHMIIVPTSEVKVVRSKEYSYPKVIINGAEIPLNVSGGSYKSGWGDFITAYCSTATNLPIEILAKIAEVATPITDVKKSDIPEQSGNFFDMILGGVEAEPELA